MIASEPKYFKAKVRFAVIVTDCTVNNLEEVIQKYTQAFSDYGEIDFCYIESNKEMKKEDLELPSGVRLFHTKQDLSFFGKIKDQDLVSSFLDIKHDILLCSYFNFNKSVNKFITRKKALTKVGIEKESLPKFDVSFLMKSENHNEFIGLSLKYLKML